jgi:uncharacterized integral membrane protein
MDQPDRQDDTAPDRRRDLRLVIVGVAAVLLIWFAIANTESVEVHFWITHAKAPVIVVIAIACLLGFAVGMVVGRRRARRS